MMLLRMTFLTVLVGALSNSGPVAVAASAGPPPNAAGAVHWDAAKGEVSFEYHGATILSAVVTAQDADAKKVTVQCDQKTSTADDKVAQTLVFTPADAKAGVILSLSGMRDFTGLFYPGIPEGAFEAIASRSAPQSRIRPIVPMFIVNARVDKLTPSDKCVDFYAALLKAGVNAELHIFSKGSHGFGMGEGRGESTALWPTSFVAWLHDCGIIDDQP